jgi:hypothetical protein
VHILLGAEQFRYVWVTRAYLLPRSMSVVMVSEVCASSMGSNLNLSDHHQLSEILGMVTRGWKIPLSWSGHDELLVSYGEGTALESPLLLATFSTGSILREWQLLLEQSRPKISRIEVIDGASTREHSL